MCNLYRLTSNVEAMRRLFGVTAGGFANLPAMPEIYPSQRVPVVRDTPEGRLLDIMSWGFPPPPAGSRPVTNVRNLASPFWRASLARPDRRCLVPADAFAEWDGPPGAKRKRWFEVDGGRTFAFAGVWRPVKAGADAGAGAGEAMAVLTCAPNALVAAIHPKAMPVILDPADHDQWLGAPYDHACALATAYPAERMRLLD